AAATGLGFAHVDIIAIDGAGHLEPAALLADEAGTTARVEAALARHHLAVAALNVALGHLHRRDPAEVSARRQKAAALARFMRRLGVRTASFYPGYKETDRPWEETLAATVLSLRELLAIAREAGITFAIEPHFDTPFQTPAQIRALLEVLPDLSVVYDPSHFAMQSLDHGDTEFLLDRTVHVHLRDAAPGAMQTAFGQGTVDFPRLLAALRDRGYRGHYAVEYLRDADFDLEDSIRRTRNAVERLG
ncbi:MAG: sugar phosphate isomerase/epimerase family protein, partial [Bacteroidota bacterium]